MKEERIVKELESVKLDKGIVMRVREYKGRTGVSISGFVEKAIEEKLEREERLRKALEV
jgi:hypothetical protein